ncbi:MAG: sigma 54-interacting transcriptional regulator [Proteobacteria bacterium]|nr:sigma 54-interacting transcriptional regulator [Pseudomonadota bacterium]
MAEKSTSFADYAEPTKIAYVGGKPTELHLRRCKLVYRGPNGIVREKAFEQSSVSLGAIDENDFVINEDTVSRRHCTVIQEPDGYILIDQGSTNGTFINGVRVREAFLRPGCTVQLGKAELQFFFADEKVPIVPSDKDHLGRLVGRSLKMRQIYGIIEKIARTGTTVVLEGETGTGKEVVAQTIHQLSERASGPMMVLDCGAVPANLIESELFGHEKGSFTGAIMTRQGLFELASGGTLFLDELGELSLDLQPKLLRALEQREVRRVGSGKALKVDVRVIAATNRNLEQEVKAGRFREDLFYRLSVVRMLLPPLRERRDDIPLLIDHMLKQLGANRRHDGSLRADHVDRDALDLLLEHEWPGNVRELFNVLERAVSFAEGGVVRVQDLPDSVRHPDAPHSAEARGADGTFKDAKERWVSGFERDYILSLLKKSNGNISHAAREADIDRKYFRKLMRKYDIDAGDASDE